MESRLATPESGALARICREWYVSICALMAVVLLSLWVHPLWMPLYDLCIAVLLVLFGPGRKIGVSLPCGRITLITVYTLLFTGLISFFINIAYKTEFIHLFFDISTLNHNIPYITSLILFPTCTVITLTLNSKSVYNIHVRNCHLHNHFNPGEANFSRMIHATYRSILKRLAIMAIVISAIDWTYYFLCYRNNTLNSPDRFFFFLVPLAIFLWSIYYVRSSYSFLILANGRTVYAGNPDSAAQPKTLSDSMIVRFLTVKDGCLLLDVSETALMDCKVDTPLVEVKPDSYKGNVKVAASDFESMARVTDFKIKLLYENYNKLFNNRIYHFLVSIDAEADTSLLPGQWVPLDGIDRMMKMGVLSPHLSDEIFRIYTIAMAGRTYDRKGRRLYPIRNYHPNFRLADLYGYDIDFDDNHWLKVARINQDKKFWRLRRLWL